MLNKNDKKLLSKLATTMLMACAFFCAGISCAYANGGIPFDPKQMLNQARPIRPFYPPVGIPHVTRVPLTRSAAR